jgi:hypothetical protein
MSCAPLNPYEPFSQPIHCPRRYAIDLIEEAAIVEWHVGEFKEVQEAATPFIKWLREGGEMDWVSN